MKLTMQQENACLKLKDGRKLSYAIYGSPVPQKTIIYLHGYPSSRYEGKLWHSGCATHNIRLVAPDRPGSGLSTFQHNRRILDLPRDILALTEHLKIHQFYILAAAEGASYALACIKEIGKKRLLGVSIVSGLYPVKLGTSGMILPSRIALWIAPWMTNIATTLFENKMGKLSRGEDVTGFEEVLSKEVDTWHSGDQKVLKSPNVWPTFVAMTKESFRNGSEGVGWEAKLNGSEWGFELAHVRVGQGEVPLALWHGTDDRNSPVAMVEQARNLLPGCVLYLKEGEGHFSFALRNADEIIQDLVGQKEKDEYMTVALTQEYGNIAQLDTACEAPLV